MNISRSEVDRIAALARLQFGEKETGRLAAEMTRILEYMSLLDEVDTTGISTPSLSADKREPHPSGTGETNRLRHDVASPSDGRSLLEQAASRDGDHLSVPCVFLSMPCVFLSMPDAFLSMPGVFRKRKP